MESSCFLRYRTFTESRFTRRTAVTRCCAQPREGPDDVTGEASASNLRGRGGACFPTGLKWTFMPKESAKPKYLCINGTRANRARSRIGRSSSGTPTSSSKVRLIACYAMGVTTAYLYVRGEYKHWIDLVQKALDDAYARGYVGKDILGSGFSADLYIHRGAGAYICGEESALMNSLEGQRGYPRVKPPFPAQNGLWGCPQRSTMLRPSPTSRLFCASGPKHMPGSGPETPGSDTRRVSGHVNKPGVYEMPTGVPLLDIINIYAGGVPGNKTIKAVIPADPPL